MADQGSATVIELKLSSCTRRRVRADRTVFFGRPLYVAPEFVGQIVTLYRDEEEGIWAEGADGRFSGTVLRPELPISMAMTV
jgi:hypothetical protein